MFGTQKWPLGHFEVARGLARSRIALWELLWGSLSNGRGSWVVGVGKSRGCG